MRLGVPCREDVLFDHRRDKAAAANAEQWVRRPEGSTDRLHRPGRNLCGGWPDDLDLI